MLSSPAPNPRPAAPIRPARRAHLRPLALVAAAFLLFAFAGVGMTGCARIAQRKAEQGINGFLPQHLGPADKYETKVSGSFSALSAGRVGGIRITGTNVRVSPDLLVDNLQLNLTDVETGTGPNGVRTLSKVGGATFAVRISGANLTRYGRARRPDLSNLQIETVNGVLAISARPKLAGYALATIRVEGTLAPRPSDPNLLDFAPDKGRLSIVPLPVPLIEYVTDQLNPAVDLSALRLPVTARRTFIENDYLVIEGDVPPNALIEASQHDGIGM